MIRKLTLLAAALSVSSASPTQSAAAKRTITKRWEDGKDCTGDTVATDGTAGLFFAVDSDGYTLSCDDVDDVSSDQ